MTILAVRELSVQYGNIIAARSVSLNVDRGEIVCLVGPNGAGKSSTTLAISGSERPAHGSVILNGEEVAGRPPEDIVTSGLSLVPEGRHIFTRLTVKENLRLATIKNRSADAIDEVFELFPILKERYGQLAGFLSGGEQQQLAIARAMMRAPSLLIVDEPSLGLSPRFVDVVFGALKTLRDRGTALLVVEQSARRALDVADRIIVMRSGGVVLEGASEALRDDPAYERAYFGEVAA